MLVQINRLFHDIQFLSALIGAIVGGSLSAFASWCATEKSIKTSKKTLAEQEKELIKNLKNSFHTELTNLKELLEFEFKKHFESAQECFYNTCVISQDYFTVFHSNTIFFGKLEDDIRNRILNIYLASKYFVDAVKGNTAIVVEYENYFDRNSISSLTQIEKETIEYQMKRRYDSLIHYKKNVLVPTYNNIIKQIDELLPLLLENPKTQKDKFWGFALEKIKEIKIIKFVLPKLGQ